MHSQNCRVIPNGGENRINRLQQLNFNRFSVLFIESVFQDRYFTKAKFEHIQSKLETQKAMQSLSHVCEQTALSILRRKAKPCTPHPPPASQI